MNAVTSLDRGSSRRASAEPFEILREVTTTHVSILGVIERAFDEARGDPDLDLLRSKIAVVLEQLRRRVAERTALPVESLLLPLVCLYDERVMVRAMEPRGEERWGRLQRADYAPREDGGDLFFAKESELLLRVNHLRQGAEPAEKHELTLLAAMYRFCLAEGFQGQCAGSPERLEERKRDLDGALGFLVQRRASPPPTAPASPSSLLDRVRKAIGI